jgi:SAM-dependent methyltransferase
MSAGKDIHVPLHRRFLRPYWAETPFPLAFERSWECRILARQPFVRPVLDVGCGEGLFAHFLFREPLDTGIDPDTRELARARKLGAYRELIACTGEHIPKPDGSYRTIFSNSVLEHIPDLGPVLRELHRLLAPGGRLYVTVPSHRYDRYTALNRLLTALGLRGLAAMYRQFFNRFWRHYHFYEPERWAELFRQHGFQVRERFTYGPGALCVLNDLLVPFCAPAMVLKRLANRWTLFPRLRRAALAPLARLGEAAARRAAPVWGGGLVFLALGKGAEEPEFARAG